MLPSILDLSAEKILKIILSKGQIQALSGNIIIFKNMAVAQVLLELYLNSLPQEKQGYLSSLFSGKTIITNQNWNPFILAPNKEGKLTGIFDVALNKKALTSESYAQDKKIAELLVNVLNIPVNKREETIKQIINLAQQYGEEKYEIISYKDYSYKGSSENKGEVTRFGKTSGDLYFTNPIYQAVWSNSNAYWGSLNPQDYTNVSIEIRRPSNEKLDFTSEDLYGTKSKLYPKFKEDLEKIIQEAKK